MTGFMNMTKNTKGFYTLEAAVFLPFVILAVISLGYFIKIEGLWENCIHGAIDESSVIALKAYNNVEAAATAKRVSKRIIKDNPQLDKLKIKDIKIMYSDLHNDSLISYRIEAAEKFALPLAFNREFTLSSKIKFRGFVGKKVRGEPLGSEGLERETIEYPVWIFPQSGEKYHTEICTYVKATVKPMILTKKLKNKYDSCSICKSKNVPIGSMVFCFNSKHTSYHIGTCRTIKRHSTVIDKTEAIKRGYKPCSKCNGG